MEKSANELSDDELIEGVLQKDSYCLSILYARYFNSIHHQCLTFVHDSQTAFDLTQDILLKAFLHLPSFHKNAPFSSWLRILSRNHCRDFLRKKKKYLMESLDNIENISIPENGEEKEKKEILEEFTDLLESLTVKEKNLLILKYGKGTSIKELQKLFNLSESAVKMRLSRAREKLLALIHTKHPFMEAKKKPGSSPGFKGDHEY